MSIVPPQSWCKSQFRNLDASPFLAFLCRFAFKGEGVAPGVLEAYCKKLTDLNGGGSFAIRKLTQKSVSHPHTFRDYLFNTVGMESNHVNALVDFFNCVQIIFPKIADSRKMEELHFDDFCVLVVQAAIEWQLSGVTADSKRLTVAKRQVTRAATAHLEPVPASHVRSPLLEGDPSAFQLFLWQDMAYYEIRLVGSDADINPTMASRVQTWVRENNNANDIRVELIESGSIRMLMSSSLESFYHLSKVPRQSPCLQPRMRTVPTTLPLPSERAAGLLQTSGHPSAGADPRRNRQAGRI